MCLWCCWKELDEQGIYWNLSGKIWIQNVGDIDFQMISAAENSNKFPKNQVLEEKNQLRTW
jgi:hypothetical protein